MGVETLARNLGLGAGAGRGHELQRRREGSGSFGTPPREEALWHHRCPASPDFSGDLPPLLGEARTVHWFDPCALLTDDARSEYRPEFRARRHGGGWQLRGCGVRKTPADTTADPFR